MVQQPLHAIALVTDGGVRVEREGAHGAPLRAQELRHALHRIAGLVDELRQLQWLPAIQIDDGRVAGWSGRSGGLTGR